jgi:hypothetical protein
MQKEKRNKQKPIPNNINDYLNEAQRVSLRQIESYGWRLEFIRRPLFQDPVPVVFGPTNGQIGVLLEDGTIDKSANILVRQ